MSVDKRVGVIGLYRSGKTVFLTSLINHLQDHDPALCPIGRTDSQDDLIRGFRELRVRSGNDTFEYTRHRQDLVYDHRWPRKTRAVAEYRCTFRHMRGDRPRQTRLSLLDIPGERLADLSMARQGYAEWCDWTLGVLNTKPYAVHCARYLSLLQRTNPRATELVECYREVLANLILNYKPVVTPSAFLLDTDGGYPRPSDWDVASLVSKRRAGLDASHQFAPVDAATRERMGPALELFEESYRAYRDTVVRPIVNWLKECHTLVILVDVTTILASGLGMYEGNQELLNKIIGATEPGVSAWGRVANAFVKFISFGYFSMPSVERIAFVAGKADKVLKADRQRMQGLLRNMTQKLAEPYDGLTTEWYVMSAVDSTVDRGDGRLEGYLLRRGEKRNDDAPDAFKPAAVPEVWPVDWSAGEFVFPDVWPVVPPRRDAPPRQFGLNQLLQFILED